MKFFLSRLIAPQQHQTQQSQTQHATDKTKSEAPLDEHAVAQKAVSLEQEQHTNQLLQALLEILQHSQTQEEKSPPKKGRAQSAKHILDTVTEAVKAYWFWLPILAFLIAWPYYGFKPWYFFEQYKIASDDSAAKIAAIKYRDKVLAYQLQMGDTLLSEAKVADALQAYTAAKAIDSNSIYAEFGIQKCQLLAFSEEKQFDPSVVYARIENLSKLLPKAAEGESQKSLDPHLLYAKAVFYWRSNASKPEAAEEIKKLYQQAAREALHNSSAALNLMAEIAKTEKDYQQAVAYLIRARELSPYSSQISNNLAYAYQKQADLLASQGQRDKAVKLLSEKALPMYQTSEQLDVEYLSAKIEIYRILTLLNRPDLVPDLGIANTIEQVESEKWQQLAKNQDQLFYLLSDGSAVFIKSWHAKKAYLLQLDWLRQYFQSKGVQQRKDLLKQLTNLQQSSVDGKSQLPRFMANDLRVLELYHGNWINTGDAAARVSEIKAVLK